MPEYTSPFSLLSSLNGYSCVITGAYGALGRYCMQVVAELGADIYAIDIPEAIDTKFSSALSERFNKEILSIPYDLTSLSQQEKYNELKLILSSGKRVKCLVNCASPTTKSFNEGWNAPFLEQDISHWDLSFFVNVKVPFLLSQMLYSQLLETNGSLVNISSIYGCVAPSLDIYDDTELNNPAGYAVSKGALNQLTRWLASALAPNIRVNTIVLGGVSAGQSDKFKSNYIKKTLLSRMATENDIIGPLAFLCSDLSSYSTGALFYVDGGWCAL